MIHIDITFHIVGAIQQGKLKYLYNTENLSRICMSVAKSENTRNALLEGTSPEVIFCQIIIIF